MKKVLPLIFLTTFIFSDGISGVSYFSYSDDDGFGLSRTYFTYKKEISNNFSYIFQTDVGQVGIDDRWTAFLKKAQANWHISDGMKLSMGLIGMNMFNIQEKTWGNRFVAKTALDAAGWGVASADMGVGVSTDFGNMLASLFMTNGEGYKNSDVDNNQKLSLQLLFGEKRLDKNVGSNIGMVYSTVDDVNGDTETVAGLFGGLGTSLIRGGLEYYTKDNASVNSSLLSYSMNCAFGNSLNLFVRQDTKDPNTDINDNETDTLMAGFIWSPIAELKICPNITKVDDGDETLKVNFQFKF